MVHTGINEELHRHHQAMEAYFANTDCGILVHSLDGSQIFSVNRAALELLDYDSREEMEACFDLVSHNVLEEDRGKLRSALEALTQVGDRISVSYRVRHKDGNVLEVIGGIKLVELNGERVYQRYLLDCTAQRVRERRAIQERTRRQNEMIHALSIDFSTVLYVDLDTGLGQVYRMCDEMRRQLNIVRDEDEDLLDVDDFKETYLRRFVYEEDQESLLTALSTQRLRRKLPVKPALYVKYRMYQNGEPVYYCAKIVRVGAWKEDHGIVVGIRNVDEETRLELQQKRQLEEALTQAEQASTAKTTFLSNMSHDIRTPMNAIIGFTELASMHTEDPARVRDYLDKIRTSGSQLLSLINDVLDMSRIESGKLRLEPAPCRLPELLQDLKTVMSGQINAKEQVLTMDTVDVWDEDVCCDRLRLNQILLNLLGNAVKFTPAGGSISLRLVQDRARSRPGYGTYVFYVRDTGIGMSEEFQSHVFEQFSRERNTTSSGVHGTGLGMAITKSIVDRMGGSIALRSQEGKGTEFVVTLELALQGTPRQDCGHAAAPAVPVEQPRLDVTGMRILLVEDNELNQEIAVELLEERGCAVEVAGDGSEAVERVRCARPGDFDLVLMDIQMPVMNGYEATRAIRRLPDAKLAAIPIVAMTANAFEEDRRRSLEAGMDGHLTKPIDIEKLVETLHAVRTDAGIK